MLGDSIGQSRAAYQGRELSGAIAASFWRHRYLYAVSLASLALAVAVGLSTGNLPDFGVIEEFSFYLLVAFWIGGCGFAIFRILWLAFAVRDPAPSRAFFQSFARFFGDRERIANSINGLAVLFVFATAFSVLKGAIAVLAPFKWDRALSHFDKALHFGHAPYEYLAGLLQHQRRDQRLRIAAHVGQQAGEHRLVERLFHVRPSGLAGDRQVAAVLELGEYAAADPAGLQRLAALQAFDDRRAGFARQRVVEDFDEVRGHATAGAMPAVAASYARW